MKQRHLFIKETPIKWKIIWVLSGIFGFIIGFYVIPNI